MVLRTHRKSQLLNAAAGSLLAATLVSCGDRYTGPFRDPNAPVIPSFADSAFGTGTAWFKPRTFETITAAGIDAQSVYSVEFSPATGSTFVALALAGGATRWTRAVPGGPDVVIAGGTAAAVHTSVSGFDAMSGAVKFTYAPPAARLVTSNGASDGTLIFVGNANGEVVALDAATGAESWKLQLDSRTDSMSVKGVSVSGGVVFAGGDGFLAAVDATAGTLKWKHVTTDVPRPFVAGPPGADAGRVSVLTFASPAWGIANYDATTGALKWSQGGTGPTASAELGALPACDAEVIAESGAPGLSALSAATGTALWSRSLSVYTSLTVTCSNGTVITNGLRGAAGAMGSDVQVLRSSDGGLVAQYPKAAGQVLRIHRVLRSASSLYVLTDKGVSAFTAP